MGEQLARRFVASLAAVAVAGCAFGVDFGAGIFRCDSSAGCPSGQVCADGYCQLPGAGSPDAATGPEPVSDASPVSQTLVFLPVADAYVVSVDPSANHGASEQLQVDGDPQVVSYLLFDGDALDSVEDQFAIAGAALELHASSAQPEGYRVSVVDSGADWSEGSLTFQNAPTMSDPVAASGPVSGSGWTSVDLAALVEDGDFDELALSTEGVQNLSLASREAGTLAPRLVLTAIAH